MKLFRYYISQWFEDVDALVLQCKSFYRFWISNSFI